MVLSVKAISHKVYARTYRLKCDLKMRWGPFSESWVLTDTTTRLNITIDNRRHHVSVTGTQVESSQTYYMA